MFHGIGMADIRRYVWGVKKGWTAQQNTGAYRKVLDAAMMCF
jgi:hypothetical protein